MSILGLALAATPGGAMLIPGIAASYRRGVNNLVEQAEVDTLAQVSFEDGESGAAFLSRD